jgi:hypothetical protein
MCCTLPFPSVPIQSPFALNFRRAERFTVVEKFLKTSHLLVPLHSHRFPLHARHKNNQAMFAVCHVETTLGLHRFF